MMPLIRQWGEGKPYENLVYPLMILVHMYYYAFEQLH